MGAAMHYRDMGTANSVAFFTFSYAQPTGYNFPPTD